MTKLASFRDGFDASALVGWTRGPAYLGAPTLATLVVTSGGRLAITPTTDYPYVVSAAFDFTDSAVAVEVDPLAPSANQEAYLTVGANKVWMFVDVPERELSLRAGAPTNYNVKVPYDPVLDRWWRILEVGGTVVYQTSPDGALWRSRGHVAHGLDLANVTVTLQAGLYGPQVAQPPVYFDNFNVLRYGETTERLYARLPELYRDEDLLHELALLKFTSLVADQASLLERIVDRLPDELADPLLADDTWLGWLAQLVGVRLTADLAEAQRRDAVRFSSSGWRAGTRDAVAGAAKSELTGTKYVAVIDHTTDVSNPGAATQWDVLVKTRATETPNPSAVLAAIIAKNAKPAGVRLYHRTYDASWATVEALGTWNAVEARGSWDNVQETGL